MYHRPRKNVAQSRGLISRNIEVYRILKKKIYIYWRRKKKFICIKKFSKKKKKIRLEDSFPSSKGTLSMKQQLRWGMQKVEHDRMKSSFMCFLSCLLISLVGSDGGKRGQKVTTGEVTWSYLAIQHRQVCLILKTARSFEIVPRIKWIFQSLRFVYNFLPSYWLPECWRERWDRNENLRKRSERNWKSSFPILFLSLRFRHGIRNKDRVFRSNR